MTRTKLFISLFMILLLGSFLRFYKLDLQSLWLDELVTMRRANLESVQEIVNMATMIDIHPPGFYIILHYWLKVFTNSEINLRILSAISGSLAILAIFILAMQLYSKREGLISALLTAVLWFPIYFSQEARPYSLLFLLSIITSIFYWQLIKKFYLNQPSNLVYSLLYTVSLVVISYIHYFGTYLVFLQGVFLFFLAIRNKKYFYEWVFIYLTVFIFYVPWIPSMYLQFTGDVAHNMYAAPDARKALNYFAYIFNESRIVLSITCLVAIALIISIYKNNKFNVRGILKSLKLETIFLLAWLIVPLVIIVLESYLLRPVFSFRNMIITFAPLLILFARLIVKSNFKDTVKNLLVFLFISFLMFNLLFTQQYYSKPTKEQFRETAKYVISEYNSAQKADIFALSYSSVCFDYYFKNFGSDIRVMECVSIENKDEEIEAALSRCYSNKLWLISSDLLPNEELLRIINKNYELVKQKKFIGAEAMLFIRK